MRTFDFAPLSRSTVGFDRLFDMLDSSIRPDWPPYDIEKVGEDEYRISMAVAGFSTEEIELTQEGFAGLLGVQRTTVNAVIRVLQDEGLVSTRRGLIEILDRPGLMRRTCECYAAIERHFVAAIGPSGTGG